MSGGSDKPTPGKTTQKGEETSKGTSSSTTQQSTAGTSEITPTLPDWMAQGLKGQFGQYLDTTGQFGQDIANWQAAGFTPDQVAGFEAARQAAGPGGMQQAGLDEMLKTARGDYLYGGDAFNAAVNAAQRQALPNALSPWLGAGRDQNFLGKANLSQIFGDIFANQYGQERGRQLQAAQLLPGQSLIPSQTLMDIGKQQQDLAQYAQNFPLTLQPQLLSALQGSVGFTSPFQGQTGATTSDTTSHTNSIQDMINKSNMTGTSIDPMYPGNKTAGILGGALTGASAGAALGPWGALGGGLIGGGMSAFA